MILIFFLASQLLKLGLSSKFVEELTDENFSSKTAASEVSLIMFYAPWCRHCQDFKPQFEEAATALSISDARVMMAKVDCTGAGKETCKKLEIPGYPTLHIFKKGIFSKKYDGSKDAEGIEYYMKKEVEPSPEKIVSKEGLERFLNLPQPSIVGFFKSESAFKHKFIKLAEQLKNSVRFGITECPENLQIYENKIVLFRPKYLHSKFEPDAVAFDGDNSDALESFILRHKHGLVGHRNKNNINEFEKPLVVAYFNVDYKKNPKGTNYWRNRIMKVAQSFSEDLTFAISAENEFPHELSEFGYEYDRSDDKPIIFLRDRDNKKYKMTEEFSVNSFEQFLKTFLAGKLLPYVKSIPLPDNSGQPVKVATANNFDEVVVNNGKDTFIKFYAPWCIHCKNLEPIFDELGKKMAAEEVSIVKMDAVNNDIPYPYEVNGFPSLYWVSKNSKKSPVKYEGGRNLDDFIQFIAQHSTDELLGYDRNGKLKAREEL